MIRYLLALTAGAALGLLAATLCKAAGDDGGPDGFIQRHDPRTGTTWLEGDAIPFRIVSHPADAEWFRG